LRHALNAGTSASNRARNSAVETVATAVAAVCLAAVCLAAVCLAAVCFAATTLLAVFPLPAAASLADFTSADAALLAAFPFAGAALLAFLAATALLAVFAATGSLVDFAVVDADLAVVFLADLASLVDFAVVFFSAVALLADFVAAAALADFFAAAALADFFAAAALADFFAAVCFAAAASLADFFAADFFAAAALLADFVLADFVAFLPVCFAAAFDIGRVCPNRGRKGSPTRGDPAVTPGRYHRMKLRCWHLFGCALGLACGPGTADDTAAGGTSTGGSTATVDTSTSDPGTDPSLTDPPTTSEPTTATTGPGECPSEKILIPIITVRIMLVLERSSSMLTLWDHDRDDLDDDGIIDGGVDPATAKVTRWSSVHRSLAPALIKSAEHYDYGVQLFPAPGAADPPADSACSVDPAPQLPPTGHTSDELLAALPPEGAVDLAGASPTGAALAPAIAALGPADGNSRVILYIGDGAPNCADGAIGDDRFEALDPATAALISAAIADDVWFWWIGVDASPEISPPIVDGEPDGVAPAEFFTMMDSTDIAVVDEEAELDSLLGGLLDTPEGGSCNIELGHPEWTFDRLEYDGKLVPIVDDCSEDGWQITGPGQLVLCGAVCDAFKEEGGVVEVFYACP
jgi:hypothetical protein